MPRELCWHTRALAWGQLSVLFEPQTSLESQAASCVILDTATGMSALGEYQMGMTNSLICVPGTVLTLVSGGELLASLLAADTYVHTLPKHPFGCQPGKCRCSGSEPSCVSSFTSASAKLSELALSGFLLWDSE